MGWLILGVYIAGWLPSAVVLTKLFENDWPSQSALDRGGNVMIGLFGGLLWPFLIPGAWVWKRVFAEDKGRADGDD